MTNDRLKMTDRLLDTALIAARAAVAVHREHLGQVHRSEWSAKGAADFVTYVDREAEEEIVGVIRASYPDHTIIAEEGTGAEPAGGDGDRSSNTSPWTWVIDPLDGTTNYLHRYPMYAVSIAVLMKGEPTVGVVASGATGEEWTAIRGRGAKLDDQAIRVSEVNRLEEALIGTGFPFKALDQLPDYLVQFDRVLRETTGIRRAGSAALDLCHLATGYFDGFWELVLAPWDFAAGALIVREAGGIITALEGELDLEGGGSVLAGNPQIYSELRHLLDSTRG